MYTVVLPHPLQSRKVCINFLKATLSYILELTKSVFFLWMVAYKKLSLLIKPKQGFIIIIQQLIADGSWPLWREWLQKKKLFQLCEEFRQASSIQCTCIRLLLLNQPLSYITVFLKYNALQITKILFPNLVNFSGDCFNQVHFFSIS